VLEVAVSDFCLGDLCLVTRHRAYLHDFRFDAKCDEVWSRRVRAMTPSEPVQMFIARSEASFRVVNI
jgi:hypothetical protein